MKLLVEIVNKNQIKKDEMIAGWIVGIEGLSLRAPHLFSLDEVKELSQLAKENDQFLMVNASRIFVESDLEAIASLLDELKNYPIKAFFYSDFGFYQLAKERNLPLIYQASTYLTNSFDVNYCLNENDNVVVGREITISEMREITKNANRPVILKAFGRDAIFHSRRPLLSSYFSYRNLDLDVNDGNYSIVEELRDEHFPIEQNEDGTHIYKTAFTYLLEELVSFENVEYLIISTKFLSLEQANEVIDSYLTFLKTGKNTLKDLGLPLFQIGLTKPSILRKERGLNEKS